MQPTQRKQNECSRCDYTWYPRGKDVSLKCPRCGDHNNRQLPSGWERFLEEMEKVGEKPVTLEEIIAIVLGGITLVAIILAALGS